MNIKNSLTTTLGKGGSDRPISECKNKLTKSNCKYNNITGTTNKSMNGHKNGHIDID